MECHIPMPRSKGRCSDLKEIIRELFNAARVTAANGTLEQG